MPYLAEVDTSAMSVDPMAELAKTLERNLFDGETYHDGMEEVKGHLNTIVSAYRAIYANSFADFETLLTPDAEFVMYGPEEMPMVGKVKGWHAILKQVIDNFSAIADQDVEVLDVIGQKGKVALLLHETGRICATGIKYDVRFTQWFRFRDGLIASIQQVVDTYSLYQAHQPKG